MLAVPSQAHIFSIIEYDELFEKSDLIIIGEPITKTKDTVERTVIPGLEQISPDGSRGPVPAAGVETVFRVRKVIMGDPDIVKITLHHLREAPADPSIISTGGPMLVRFEPSVGAFNGTFLLFLMKEADGRYAPYGGQTDPSGRSIFKLGSVD
jgi:hypothetical protein